MDKDLCESVHSIDPAGYYSTWYEQNVSSTYNNL